MLKNVGICWNMLEYVGMCWNMLEYVKNCRVRGVTMLNTNVGKNVENDQNMLKTTRIC